MTVKSFTAACVQLRSGRSLAANIDHVVPLVRAAIAAGADYVQTPEMTSLVERDRESLFRQVGPADRDPMLSALREVAREGRIWLHLGSMATRAGDRMANRAFLIGPDGSVAATYDKIHLFDVNLSQSETWRESNTYTGGSEAVVARLPWGMLGMTICYDLRFPQLYRSLAEAGADILSTPACFTRKTGEAHWSVLQRARAIENGAFMISAAQAGLHEDGRETFGHSMIVDPWGRVLAEAGAEPGVILASVDVSEVAAVRGRIMSLAHGRPYAMNSPPLPAGLAAE